MTQHQVSARAPQHPDFLQAQGLLAALVAALRSAAAELPAGVPNNAAAEARLASGIPALTGEPLADWCALARNVEIIADAIADADAGVDGQSVLREPEARAVLRGLERLPNVIDREALATVALAGAWDAAAELAPQLGLDPDLLVTLLDYAARPALRAGAAQLRALLAAANWNRGTCPACGSAPTLAVVRGKEHERHLHCGRCGTPWAFPRMRCPSCGETRHDRLGNLHAEGEGEFRRVEVCESCRGYVKSIAALDAPSADRLLQLDLETAALDFLALEHGYSRRVP
ncbi:MAG TPA: formate dehydrogenase accessory protein FdhE [Gemmatimonadales bacterium]|nr:formate dehydrogenase accessory protein FdhE [Gemmatimonadales bacterium]